MVVKFQRNGHVFPGFLFMKTHCIIVARLIVHLVDAFEDLSDVIYTEFMALYEPATSGTQPNNAY